MNKAGFINALKEKTGLDEEKCTLINGILEDNFIIGKSGKEKIITAIAEKLGFDDAKAEEVYETAMSIVGGGIKDKLKHPFGSQN